MRPPNSVGRTLKLSGPPLAGMSRPATAANVAIMSTSPISSFDSLPGLILPGQRAMNGSRWPPSYRLPL